MEFLNSHPIRILMIEDDMTYRALCERYFAKDTGCTYELDGVSSAATAITLCQEQTFDCLIVDYELPDSTGTQLITSLHSTMGEMMPPAVMLTVGDSVEVATEALRANATDFLSKKHVSASSLCRSVSNAVEKGRLKRQYHESNKQLNLAFKQLQLNSEEIKNFYHVVSHEVKTPLTAIQEFLSLIKDEVVGPISEQQKELLGYSLESCNQIATHFSDLLDLARMDTGKLKLNKSMDSTDRLISRSIRGLSGVAARKGIEIISPSIDTSQTPNVLIDANRIVQIISNLLNNAIRHSEPNEVIRVECNELNDNTIQISVIDMGCGIDDVDIPRIFDRLYQVDKGLDRSTEGLGLGLSIARDIAHLHDGELLVESQLGQGSTFTLQLPLAGNTS